ncbi:GNAT family N-acetyltransferase [bacterium]|nr:MAG: GNAT family N-acetyltransferase [bacterium]
MSELAFFVEPLSSSHDRKNFDCGEPSLNQYLQRFAPQNTLNGSSRTYVATTADSSRICAYFTLSAGAVATTDFPEDVRKDWPRLVPTVHLGRFAVDIEVQGQQLGRALLDAVFQKALNASEILGIAVIEVWALNDSAHRFYQKFEFQSLEDDPIHQYLSLSTLREVF